jgi:hypothetical protein
VDPRAYIGDTGHPLRNEQTITRSFKRPRENEVQAVEVEHVSLALPVLRRVTVTSAPSTIPPIGTLESHPIGAGPAKVGTGNAASGGTGTFITSDACSWGLPESGGNPGGAS